MACLETLQDDVAAILAVLQSKKDCCDDNITYGPSDEVETDIDPGEGDPPDEYGETEITTWDDWYEHVCYNAHQYVDALVAQAEQLDDAVGWGFLSIGLVAAVLVALSFTGLGLALSYAAAAAALIVIQEGGTLFFGDTADDIEDARNDIVCAFLQGTSLGDAVEDAIGSLDPAWAFFSLIDYDSAQAIIYEGGYNGEYLPTETKDDCSDCGYDQLFEEDVTIHVVNTFGTNLQYSDGVWSVDSQRPTDTCQQIWLQFFTDSGKTTYKSIRIEVLTCTHTSSLCYSVTQHTLLIHNPSRTLVTGVNHPSLLDVDSGIGDDVYITHLSPVVTITFKLYEPS